MPSVARALYIVPYLIKARIFVATQIKSDICRSGSSAVPLNFREWPPKRQSAFPTIDVGFYPHRGIIGAHKPVITTRMTGRIVRLSSGIRVTVARCRGYWRWFSNPDGILRSTYCKSIFHFASLVTTVDATSYASLRVRIEFIKCP